MLPRWYNILLSFYLLWYGPLDVSRQYLFTKIISMNVANKRYKKFVSYA